MIKKRLLLHACCAPCCSGVLETLMEKYDVTVYFYNPNINTLDEFGLRAEAVKQLCRKLAVDYIIEDYHPHQFLDYVKGREEDREGGRRCEICFDIRLSKTAGFAKEHAFDIFTTTLSVSPYKNAGTLNRLGEQIAATTGAAYLPADFKKKNGYLKSVQNSKKFNLYRQNFCGCQFSIN